MKSLVGLPVNKSDSKCNSWANDKISPHTNDHKHTPLSFLYLSQSPRSMNTENSDPAFSSHQHSFWYPAQHQLRLLIQLPVLDICRRTGIESSNVVIIRGERHPAIPVHIVEIQRIGGDINHPVMPYVYRSATEVKADGS